MMKAQTVTGVVPADKLGITLCHEHFLLDCSCWLVKVQDDRKFLADAPVSMENLGELRRDPLISKDNLVINDKKMVLEDVLHFKKAGGRTMVDCTTIGLRQDVKEVRRIAQRSKVNIVAGTGFYIDVSHPSYVKKKSAEELAAIMTNEIDEGIDGTGIKCGIIGEIGISWPMTKDERKVLEAAAIAQQETQAAINVHPGMNRESPFIIAEVLKNSGANMDRVVISHLDNRLPDVHDLIKIADAGIYVEFDTFGAEVYYDSLGRREATDFERVSRIKQLISRGYASKILLSHDTGWKMQFRKYGGFGYSHVLRHIVPMFKKDGIKQEHIDSMLVENPKAVLAFIK